MSYTNGGGTLTLPSPTHGHHVDVGSAVRSLRRSISRSPSKFNLAARTPNSTESPTSSSPSPQSPCRRYSPALTARKSYLQLTPKEKSTPRHETTTAMPTVTTTPSHCPPQPSSSFKPSVKLSLRSARFSKPSQVGSTTPSGPPPRTRASPRSPLKRALSISSDSANSAPSSSSSSDTPGQENSRLPNPASPLSRRCLNKPSRHSLHLDVSGASHSIFRSLDTTTMAAPEFSSPAAGTLKRSDAAMDLETGSLASPVAKRRSLHGIASFSSMAHDNVFDQATPAALNFDIHDDVAQNNYALAGSTIRRETQPSPTPTPSAARRSSSLRKSTLQQRHGDKGSWGRRTGAQQLAQMGAEIPSPSRNRPRLSTDQFVPPPAARDNPFPGGSLFSGSMQNPATTHSTNPHPLSRSLKPSVSGSCFVEDSPIRFEPAPNQAPTRRLDRFKFSLGSSTSSIFSKSLPPAPQTAQLTQTPVVPPPAARSSMFMSSGLVSKVNRDPEEDKRMAVPDTPCKKSSSASFATYPPASAVRFRRGPATPIPFGSPHADRQSTPFSGTGKGLGLFHRLGGRPHRRASVLNLDEENKSSASSRDGASTPEGFPPTPTKSFLTPAVADGGLDRNIIDSPSANRRAPPISAVKPAFSREPSSSPIRPRGSPKTPLDGMLHLDPSRFSISNNGNGSAERYSPVPVTPSTSQGDRRIVTPIHVNKQSRIDIDGHLVERFHSVEEIGRGEFSVVYRVAEPKRVGGSLGLDLGSSPPLAETPPVAPAPGSAFAVKKTRHIFAGPRDRDRKMKEVEILKSLVHAKHVLRFVDSWEMQGHLYIQTEYCDEGTLQGFLNDVGHRGRMDDFRLWKILYDMLLGLQEVHNADFMHLDMKPANIFITHEGVLKIGDFGLAAKWPVTDYIDAEGDREYIGPEILTGQYGKPSDLFAVGLMTLEMAGNVQLPDNGLSWQALRSGQYNDLPVQTPFELIGMRGDEPIPRSTMTIEDSIAGKVTTIPVLRPDFGVARHQPLAEPPAFMAHSSHSLSLDSLMRQLTHPDPDQRPTVNEVLEFESFRWVASRRRCAATVFEGLFGPREGPTQHGQGDVDTVMMDA